ncbi:hypothetical protein DMB42_11755 [Nonomuraea sp. WAC 01424]|uniref:zinc finger domain-containing protein n=1 Tax=Nonomuraea sp. WAC 01424 TaxID=2203200 RepID=UPI000F7680A7|nr:hypothetical protein [Nonomuraea sp. WAC 01424]RSN12846.1 hypothetical protein DMB42_11755 [Nonomuraea sp. WAC 01424]
MTPEEVIDLLTTAAAYDRRKVGQTDVVAWHAAVKDLDFLDAQDAVIGHYTETTDWLMPAHVRTRVKAIRAARVAFAPVPAPPAELADTPGAYQAAILDAVAKMARGFALPKQITARAEPSEEWVTRRGEDHDPTRAAAILVACPWPPCKAMPGAVCVDADGRRLTAPAHEARLKAAGLTGEEVP